MPTYKWRALHMDDPSHALFFVTSLRLEVRNIAKSFRFGKAVKKKKKDQGT